jgi:hypothetical protein
MAKALIGHLNSGYRAPVDLTIENARLRARVRELEELVLSLKVENDALVASHTAALESAIDELQPA